MSEFVEESLERLIPVFELLQTIGLFSPTEVKEFVKRCRNYEYRLQKTCKDPKDFLYYVEYLRDALELVRVRRRKLNYKFKHNEVDGALKTKIADVYRRVTLRFQGQKNLWRQRLDFLKKEKMRVRCSKAFFRAVQVHGNDVQLREEAANWEFSRNKSIDNARLHLQLALRHSPEATSLWLCLFKIEILNVQRLLERRNVLTGEKEKPNAEDEASSSGEKTDDEGVTSKGEGVPSTSDPVFDLKLAEIVADQAMKAPDISDKNEMLLELWRCANKCGEVAKRLENEFFGRLWLPENVCEESWIARYERIPNQDPYDVLDKACSQFDSEKLLRYYIQVCNGRAMVNDIYATIKKKELLIRLHEKGCAKIDDYTKLLSYGEDCGEKINLLTKSLERFPSSSFLWAELIRAKTEAATDRKEMEKLFNEAEQKVEPKEALLIYQLAIDWAIENTPSRVDAVFKKAILSSCPEVSSEIKCIRLRYCKAAFSDDPTAFRDEYKRICSSPPNEASVHKTYIYLESQLAEPENKLIVAAMENYVADFGSTRHECWIDYAKYLIGHDPAGISKLYQRALACIPKEEYDIFMREWTLLVQNSQSPPEPKRKRKLKRQLEKAEDENLGTSLSATSM